VCKQEQLEFPCLYRPSLFIGIPYLVVESGVESDSVSSRDLYISALERCVLCCSVVACVVLLCCSVVAVTWTSGVCL
jgi:hypothetical protein